MKNEWLLKLIHINPLPKFSEISFRPHVLDNVNEMHRRNHFCMCRYLFQYVPSLHQDYKLCYKLLLSVEFSCSLTAGLLHIT